MSIFEDKTVVVTGGTGSLGKTLVRRLLGGEKGTPRKIIVFSRDEAKQHEMRLMFQNRSVTTDEVIYRNFMQRLEFRIGDVRDYRDVCSVLKNADIVINAAALKQVPTCEYFPMQAVMTNVTGASNIVQAITENDYPVQTVVGVSTDKACKPVNVMGMTKSLQEKILLSANVLNKDTRFVCVRYGNVLASRGSVIPLFRNQILHGGPVTVTLPEMTRFLLSLNEAVDTVFEAVEWALPGDTVVPRAFSATVFNIARALIGDRDIEVCSTGIRPGEKMHEILISEEEAYYTIPHGDYFSIRSSLPELSGIQAQPKLLEKEFSSADTVLDLPGTIELLNKHGLLASSRSEYDVQSELLR
ncbi:polysaccharide biosynthesis protein [Saccharibacillus sp. CPCC 101409]|uniref:polysaccharide biosynthesis protein n=1 Tax=Saccharibacillus sp. CPCC 101409 TaxID=3058041 RepID=UPI0026722DAA|nr:polysaccharide biosynthesis protein [Saccharibacillus sp. CPCC 101409]MDO3412020.1 polysaccharide biosynthesis protein [Saccharibacillus sp. CPCC 101409]